MCELGQTGQWHEDSSLLVDLGTCDLLQECRTDS